MNFTKHSARFIISFLILASLSPALEAAKITKISTLDQEWLMIVLIDGEVQFNNDKEGVIPYEKKVFSPEDNTLIDYGTLDIEGVLSPTSWKISSPNDPAYKMKKSPDQIRRKAKVNGMAQLDWDATRNDYNYATTLEHTVYLHLPTPMLEGKEYSITIGPRIAGKTKTAQFVFDTKKRRSESIHINLTGFMASPSIRAVDIYQWLGDGGPRDYSGFVGNKTYLLDIKTGEQHEVGKLALVRKSGKDVGKYDLTGSDVWTADFTGFDKPGSYRLVIEGIGCSQDFSIKQGAFADPFKVSLKGFYYMRIGESENPKIRPIPRQPRYIPGIDPLGCKVLITSMQPYHPEWESFVGGDKWDKPDAFKNYLKRGMENPKAIGGHSDALDWDRHLGHVSIIYDMLYPFILTGGVLKDDDTGISESGNGIPDILDEARNEVDFWLNLKEGEGYSHGLTNPDKDGTLYQAGTTVVAAWANAANAAMLAECFRIAGLSKLEYFYKEAAEKAYQYAENQKDQQLDKIQHVGDGTMRGADFKFTAAAYLFNLTGMKEYEDDINELSLATDDQADIQNKNSNQIWGTAGYLLTPHKVRFPALVNRMKQCVINSALKSETALMLTRPSRRSTDEEYGYFYTAQNVHRTMLAHRISVKEQDKRNFLDALILEADWGLGRNGLNMIMMTTATTPLAKYRSIENIYTSGQNDGTPGLHPGHTPYLNTDNWWEGMIMSKPRWMAERGYPDFPSWPRGECYYNTRWVWAHSEFTPQQTMRGKMALYGYLYGIDHP